MTDDLLHYYNRELTHIRKHAGEFARANPDVAAQLRLDATGSQDPYVERLIEAFAYLNARTRKKIDDDFPEVAEAVLGILYPHYVAPVPSMAIAQFELDASQTTLVQGFPLPAKTALETEEVEGDTCEFRTGWDIRLYPLRVLEVGLTPIGVAPVSPAATGAAVALRVKLGTFAPSTPAAKLVLPRLDFFLGGEPLHANTLYQKLVTELLDIAVTGGGRRDPVVSLGRPLKPVGFDTEYLLLPSGARSFPGYLLLTEYFALPDKFRFLQLERLDEALPRVSGDTFEIYFYLKHASPQLQGSLTTENFRLGCTPIVNLFPAQADPLQISHKQWRYQVIPDARRPQALEIYSVDEVSATTADHRTLSVRPLFSIQHAGAAGGVESHAGPQAFWYPQRRAAGYRNGVLDPGTEVELVFADLCFEPADPAVSHVDVSLTCLNRDLPARLPFGPGRPKMKVLAGGPLAPVRCLTPPTPTLRPAMRGGLLWRAVSHLSLNHLSLVDGQPGAAALKELLALYDFANTPERRARIEGIASVAARRHTAMISCGDAGLCRGMEVTLEFDRLKYADNGAFLLASALERFLAQYCSINSFSRLVFKFAEQSEPVYTWPPRSGTRQLL